MPAWKCQNSHPATVLLQASASKALGSDGLIRLPAQQITPCMRLTTRRKSQANCSPLLLGFLWWFCFFCECEHGFRFLFCSVLGIDFSFSASCLLHQLPKAWVNFLCPLVFLLISLLSFIYLFFPLISFKISPLRIKLLC